ncbi:CHASE2 domain-containing protein [Elongatibacter sediminis]|uniref:Adenylate/guanylate cyclase domain-containing protein n=1 Tax=Elongatibacter sediminis TaxID=3119006 RepID=A0AAW9RBF6_9GAMM
MKRYLIRAGAGLLLTLFLLGHVAGSFTVPFIDEVENLLYDTRVRLTAPRGLDDRIVIIAVDEASVQEQGYWPWQRTKLARLVRNLFDHGVAVVGWDMVFAERDESADVFRLENLAAEAGDHAFLQRLEEFEPQLDRDAIFAEALASGPSVLGFFFDTNEQTAYETGELPLPAFDFHESMAEIIFLPRGAGFTSNRPELTGAAYSAGFINNPLIDEDGIIRRAPLLHEYDFSAYESLSLAVAATYFNEITLPIFVDESRFMGDYPPLEGLELAGRPIPIDPQGAVLVPYRGPRGSFPYISASDVIEDRVEDPAVLDGAIALIGATAPGLQDIRSTPFGSVYPGVEVHANVISGILDGTFRWEPAYTAAAEMIAVIAFGILGSLALPILSPIIASLGFAALLISALAVNLYVWSIEMHVLPLAITLMTIIGIYALNMVFGYLFETRSRSHMDSLFGQYVPPDLVKDMSRDPEHYTLESEKLELSVLFSDIRGFTSISEGLDAGDLSELINQYLTPMTRIVHESKGTIDKYIGDAVMAFWGAPLRDSHHAARAVAAGMEMLAALPHLNKAFKEHNWPEVAIGIGINTGTMSVGNMGSEFRRAYTVLGDSVNLGSRLEGLTKAYGVSFIVSETTALQAPEFIYRELDCVRVKGKAEPVTIYEPLGLRDQVPGRLVEDAKLMRNALRLYRERNWDAAESVLQELQSANPGFYLYALYLQRIAHFREHPPEEGWDGVFTHETK